MLIVNYATRYKNIVLAMYQNILNETILHIVCTYNIILNTIYLCRVKANYNFKKNCIQYIIKVIS